jgi:hypothetical protein
MRQCEGSYSLQLASAQSVHSRSGCTHSTDHASLSFTLWLGRPLTLPTKLNSHFAHTVIKQ